MASERSKRRDFLSLSFITKTIKRLRIIGHHNEILTKSFSFKLTLSFFVISFALLHVFVMKIAVHVFILTLLVALVTSRFVQKAMKEVSN